MKLCDFKGNSINQLDVPRFEITETYREILYLRVHRYVSCLLPVKRSIKYVVFRADQSSSIRSVEIGVGETIWDVGIL